MYVFNAHYMFAQTTHCVQKQEFGGPLGLMPVSITNNIGGALNLMHAEVFKVCLLNLI